MSSVMRLIGTGLISAALVVAVACGEASTTPVGSPDLGFATPTDGGVTVAEAMPDFRLLDASPVSARAGQQVSPRDLRGKISAWYFADAG